MAGRVLVLLHRAPEQEGPGARVVRQRLRVGDAQRVERQLVGDVGVAPLLLVRVGHRRGVVHAPGVHPPLGEPVRLVGGQPLDRLPVQPAARAPPLPDPICNRLNHAPYPTEPSISSSIRRFSSTAYSSGSSLAIGSMNPRTMSAIASSSVIPRLVR